MLTETVELVAPGELGIQRDELTSVSDGHDVSTVAVPAQNGDAKAQPQELTDGAHVPGNASAAVMSAEIVQPAEDEGSRLRQRLKAAVKGATGHS